MTELASKLEAFLDEEAPRLVRAYFVEDDGGPAFTGAHFERLASSGNDANRITPADLVAVTTLSVDVPPKTAIWVLDRGAGPIQALLAQIPADIDLWSEFASIDESSAAWKLWGLLEELPGVGWVTAGKLCARKRPRLIPILDRVTRDALKPPKNQFWLTLRTALAEHPELVRRLGVIHTEASVPEEVSLLRVLDIAIWMRNHGKAWAADPAIKAIPSIE